jgi:hypothetical protein
MATKQNNGTDVQSPDRRHTEQRPVRRGRGSCTESQEQLTKLDQQNYALTVHLKQAQQGSFMLGHFHPRDILKTEKEKKRMRQNSFVV